MSDRTPDEILEYCEKATAGPWRVESDLIETDDEVRESPQAIYAGAEVVFGGFDDWDDGSKVNHNAYLVAAARVDLPRMAKRVKELEAENLALKDAISTRHQWDAAMVERDSELELDNVDLKAENAKLKAADGESVEVMTLITNHDRAVDEVDALKALCQEAAEVVQLELAFHDHAEECNMCSKLIDIEQRLSAAGGGR